MNSLLERLLDYDVWANQEVLRAMEQGAPPARSLKWMGHIVGAELLWLSRMQGRASELPVWPELTLQECTARLRPLPRAFAEALTGDLARPVPYINSKGESWSSTVEDILIHVVIHSAYHRGQIASDMRNGGLEPAYTDYIHAVRQGLIE